MSKEYLCFSFHSEHAIIYGQCKLKESSPYYQKRYGYGAYGVSVNGEFSLKRTSKRATLPQRYHYH